MASKTKKIKAAGRFGSGYGTQVRKRLNVIEGSQRQRQTCPYCSKKGVKREAAGIWYCKKCEKRFAGHAYMLAK